MTDERTVYLVTGDKPTNKARPPLGIFSTRSGLVAFLDGVEEDGIDPPENLRVFAVDLDCLYYANAPATGREVLDGWEWPRPRRLDSGKCLCGWNGLGRPHSGHHVDAPPSDERE